MDMQNEIHTIQPRLREHVLEFDADFGSVTPCL